MRTTLPVILGLVLFSAACSDGLTSPTPIEDGVTDPSNTPRLRWDLIAPGCSPRTAPSPLPSSASARVTQEADGSITASWLNYVLPGGGSGLLYARFVRSGTEWALCFWDTAGV